MSSLSQYRIEDFVDVTKGLTGCYKYSWNEKVMKSCKWRVFQRGPRAKEDHPTEQ